MGANPISATKSEQRARKLRRRTGDALDMKPVENEYMKKIAKFLSTLAIAGSLFLSACNVTIPHPVFHIAAPKPEALYQQKTSHLLAFTDDGDPRVFCTGTAIGPHAILTAEHCDLNSEFSGVMIDYSRRTYNIIESIPDNRDHIILMVDGPEFKNIEPVVTAAVTPGESVFFYGFGGGDYPAHEIKGTVKSSEDPSDVDASDSIVYLKMRVIHGDSGSAVYDKQGNIVTVITYTADKETTGIGFGLNFTPEQLTESHGAGHKSLAKRRPKPSNPFEMFKM